MKTVITKSRSRDLTVWLALFTFFALLQPAAQETDKAQQPAEKKPEKKEKQEKSYGLIFGTAYGPDDRPLYGVRINIRPEGKKHPSWELFSDHRGEFAQRVPTTAADYLITGEAEYAPTGKDGKPQMSKKKRLTGEAKVHMEGEIRQDIGLHLTE
ncbi:MAG TPA: hypothetical protein VKH81_20150 [Candidatus Angelobacter sp.]|nr:hypothetical protein [Candidatus Angelobacter sp.]